MFRKFQESKPGIMLICVLGLLAASFVIRTWWIAPSFIRNAESMLEIVSDSSAYYMEDALPTLFWLPALCYFIMYILYVKAQHGVDPAAEMRKNGIAILMLLVLIAAELVASYIVLTSSMSVLTLDEMDYAVVIKNALFKAYGIAIGCDIVLYLIPAFVGRPRR